MPWCLVPLDHQGRRWVGHVVVVDVVFNSGAVKNVWRCSAVLAAFVHDFFVTGVGGVSRVGVECGDCVCRWRGGAQDEEKYKTALFTELDMTKRCDYKVEGGEALWRICRCMDTQQDVVVKPAPVPPGVMYFSISAGVVVICDFRCHRSAVESSLATNGGESRCLRRNCLR